MLNNIGQFNYSNVGGTTFIPAATTPRAWSQIYRKALLNTPTTTTTSTTPAPPDYYLADEYDCTGCTIINTNVLVEFPGGSSVTLDRFYAPVSVSGFVYKVTTSTTSGSPSVPLQFPSTTSCALACSL
jgi:hypothetical protein